MKNLYTFLAILFCNSIFSQNLQLLGHRALPSGQEGSGLWGYTSPGGREYALCGESNGIGIYEVTTGTPRLITQVPAASGIWHEVRTFGNYAYAVQDNSASNGATEGLLIIDLSNIDSNIETHVYRKTFGTYTILKGHTIHIDEPSGRAFINGGSVPNGAVMALDLNTNPMNPTLLGTFGSTYSGNKYVHDSYVRGNKIYMCHIYDGIMEMVDFTNINSQTQLGTVSTPNNFTHNVWLNDAGTVAFTTDERDYAWVAAYDITDPTDIKEIDRFGYLQSTGSFPHNVHVKNDFVYASYYAQGIVVIDAHEADAMTKVGHYDTSPNYSGGGFNGAWSVYPYFSSGKVLAQDIEEGLYVFQENIQRAGYLSGTVTDAISGATLSGVTVVLTGYVNESTNAIGKYKFGIDSAGTIQLTFSKFGYISQTVNCTIARGVINVKDVQLQPIQNFSFSANVTDATTSVGISGAKLRLVSTDGLFDTTLVSNANGNFTMTPLVAGTYDMFCGHWGHITQFRNSGNVTGNYNTSFALQNGIQDEFALDLGWAKSFNAATSGFWQLGEPKGTLLNGNACNPENDVATDLGTDCYTTGNNGTAAGDDDIDNGSVTLTSPACAISSMTNPVLKLNFWFVNGGGSGSANDDMKINLTDGATTITAKTVTPTSDAQNTWNQATINIKSFIANPTNNMRIQIVAEDLTPGHVVEAAIDNVTIYDQSTVGTNENFLPSNIYIQTLSSNTFVAKNSMSKSYTFSIYDINGKIVDTFVFNESEIHFGGNLPKGFYMLKINEGTTDVGSIKVVKI